jgi:uncharacterized protein
MATTPTDSPSSQRVVITGATGLIGTALVASLEAAGHPVTKLVRRPANGPNEAQWDPTKGTIDAAALEGAWAVVHLAGHGIGEGKWTEEHKKKVLDSRVQGTTLIAKTIASLKDKPTVFACGSAVGVYGNRDDEELTEESGAGTGFLANLVVAWESCAVEAEKAGVRTVLLRTGIVQSVKGGALKQQLLPFKLGVGGRFGNGKQYIPWISITDEVRAIEHILHTPSISGPVNLVSPQPVTNSEYTKALGKALSRPTLIPIPLFPVKMLYGAEMVKEMLLVSNRVLPTKLLRSNFTFVHTNVNDALPELIKKKI